MLARLSIRDIVLIERLDIEFAQGLAVLTGETGAGKSILLDAFALALGGRGDAGLVRHGAEQGQVAATFDVPKGHPASDILSDNDLDDTGEMILRRVQLADGRSRAFINDQPVSVQTLKAVGAALVEIHGQHDERALVDAVTHRRLLDAFAGLDKDVAALETLWATRRTAQQALDEHRAGMERAAREADYLRHASDELKKLAPQDGEETTLAERRTVMMQGEFGTDLAIPDVTGHTVGIPFKRIAEATTASLFVDDHRLLDDSHCHLAGKGSLFAGTGYNHVPCRSCGPAT